MTITEPNLTDGERWSRELLDRLREDGFTPGAWRRFFADALRRARTTRARRPGLVRQSRRWGALGLVAATPFGARAATSWAAWWAMLDWHLGMADDDRPLSAADALTLTRLWAAPIVRRHPEPWLVAAGLATDLADGALARRTGPTRLGRDLDSAADTLFLNAALRGCVDQHGLNARVLTLERARLLLATGITLRSYFAHSQPAPEQRNRELPALMGAAGLVLATQERAEAATPLLLAATLIRLRRPTSVTG